MLGKMSMDETHGAAVGKVSTLSPLCVLRVLCEYSESPLRTLSPL